MKAILILVTLLAFAPVTYAKMITCQTDPNGTTTCW